MTDVHSRSARSFNMSRIRGKNTKPELIVRQYLHGHGLRYRLHVKGLPGKPDIVFPGKKTVIFVHGCFWHQHENCRYFVVPKTRTEFWLDKIGRNVANDERQCVDLRRQGWRVLVIWECELKPAVRDRTLERLFYSLTAPDPEEVEG
jgi:DNA mismatch endonuclease (patch repair protein)